MDGWVVWQLISAGLEPRESNVQTWVVGRRLLAHAVMTIIQLSMTALVIGWRRCAQLIN